MHKQNIVHRDIKPENILISPKDNGEMILKITDFGFASFYNPLEDDGNFTQVLGTPMYMAPEIFKEKKYNQAVDIWATGIITYIMLTGKKPFRGKLKEELE
mmetsp:Transcript_29995/g.45862  ORF Transcript_29995/g.45862 Transcript_29995/m.45862 type:complete len:101 (-) Transcript_29995:853-1155(-)|eukprot:CAMPEP_0170481610 /NCGR_PEP_ID=MMETSP0208-20121228/1992_1 /TAXON_ID=197538 /ORGANISM="Strombidium inclinatum, Strain S3" /LENGTH=100 /DNA_ID=CAMNT_0010754347 /DNA_START=522 /DNA_END=824 /DNA_ORIENTATION=+